MRPRAQKRAFSGSHSARERRSLPCLADRRRGPPLRRHRSSKSAARGREDGRMIGRTRGGGNRASVGGWRYRRPTVPGFTTKRDLGGSFAANLLQRAVGSASPYSLSALGGTALPAIIRAARYERLRRCAQRGGSQDASAKGGGSSGADVTDPYGSCPAHYRWLCKCRGQASCREDLTPWYCVPL